MLEYQKVLQQILKEGIEKESGRSGMPNTIGISNAVIKMNLQEGFPLLTTKKMYWKGIVHELLWFLRGNTNIKYLVDNNVHIWDQDAYRWYLKQYDSHYSNRDLALSFEDFIKTIKENSTLVTPFHFNPSYKLGDLGKVYGYQWRNQNGVDQIKEVLDGLKSNPYSRYHIIDGWNKADFKDMALPPCHLLYQFIVRPLTIEQRQQFCIYNEIPQESFDISPKFYLDLNMYQRSCDTFLGVPFNLASMSLLLKIFAKTCNMLEGEATWIGGDTHLYVDHIPMVKEQLKRKPYQLPLLEINKPLNILEDILSLTIDNFELRAYQSHDSIKAELFTGLKPK